MMTLLLALASAANAQVKPPIGWITDPAAAISQSKQLATLAHFGGLPTAVTTDVFQTRGATLYVTKLRASVAGIDATARDKAASAQLGELMTVAAGKLTDASDTRDNAGPHALEGTHRWHDTETKVVSSNRIVIAADAQQLVAVIGECVLGSDVTKDVDTACHGALASLDPGIPPASRVDLSIVKSAKPAPVPTAPVPAGSSSSGPSLVESGPRPSLPPMQIPQEQREPDRRPVYVGLGLIVLAVIFYWNRKNREKLEREYEQRTADKPEQPMKPAAAKRDGDADDLHAAAADDGTKEDSKT